MGGISAIVMCAGQGTRMKSARAKVLHEVAGVPMCCWPLKAVLDVAGQDVIAVVGHHADAVKKAIGDRFGGQVKFALQQEQRGTGDAVRIALAASNSSATDVVVACGDTPLLTADSIRKLVHEKENAKVVFAMTMLDDPAAYGRVTRDDEGHVVGIVEFKDATPAQRDIREINVGLYVFDADFLRDQITKLTDKNMNHEFYLTDLIASARRLYGPQSVKTISLCAEEVLGVNDRTELANAESIMRARLTRQWMLQGVTMMDPATTYVGADVELSPDVTLHPNVQLLGRTKIEQGATIYANSVIENSVVGIKAQVGPFARLRPGTVLEENAKVGNFVETKKSRLRKGSKANHLAYIGDADVGEGANIGAGTITCNYDGFNKHPTHIGDGVFIGSNSTLVAPLQIGRHAYVAAGSTITRDIPENDLAISRGRQENKTGYATRIRSKLKKEKPEA